MDIIKARENLEDRMIEVREMKYKKDKSKPGVNEKDKKVDKENARDNHKREHTESVRKSKEYRKRDGSQQPPT